MTYAAVSIAVRTVDELEPALSAAAGAVGDGARLIEWRLDALAGRPDGPATVLELLRRSPAPSIVTCRGRAEGGEFDGPEEVRAEFYRALVLAEHPPRYIDIELSAWQGSPTLRRTITAALDDARAGRDVHTSLILSTHDFERRPADLLQRVEAMTNEPACSVIKVAWMARSLRDNLEALDLAAERHTPTIALCMGQFGLMSRVLGAKAQALLVYAGSEPGAETAPGQPSIGELKTLYRFDSIGPSTAVYGVIGWPVSQSLGPVIHNAGFAAVGHDGVYLPLPIPAEYEHFKATVGSLVDHERLTFRGASVTAPHKEHLVRFVQERGGRVDEVAQRVGAANTLIVGRDGPLECMDTDTPVIVASLCGEMGIDTPDLAGRRVAVLGAGGVARAVTNALADVGAEIVVFNRTRARADALAESFRTRRDAAGRALQVSVGEPDSIADGDFRIFINCTSVGMTGGPAPEASPLPDTVPLDESMTVFDTVYAPARTPLLRRAEASGARAISGLDMFLRQAALQFLVWTGHEAPIDAFRASITGRSGEGPDRT
ncbi:MAG: type I 3-dehydroquinate dehydratase [Planctomycetes bacterium]|nr:type I 3-dehydroquinate dehydratase [Planctomycetota bacterium]